MALLRSRGGWAVLCPAAWGGGALGTPKEPIYGQAVREMEQTGSWMIPTVNGKVFAEKPMLYYWTARICSFLPGGSDEGNLRLPSLIAALGSVWMVWFLVLPYAGRRRAITAAGLFATTFSVFWAARTIQMDVLVMASTLGVLLPLSRVADHGMNRWKGWLLAGFAAGLGFLGKGPVAWLLPALVFGGYLLWTGRLKMLFAPAAFVGALLAILTAAPWHLWVWWTGNGAILEEMYLRQNMTRFVNAWDHANPWWYYLEYYWIDMAPWAFLTPLCIGLPHREEKERKLDLFAWIWIVAILGFFSLSQSKRSAYMLPIAPAVAFLASGVWLRLRGGLLSAARRRFALGVHGLLGGLVLLGGAAAVFKGIARYPELAIPVGALASVMIAGGLIILVGLVRPTWRRTVVPWGLAGFLVAFYLVASVAVLPQVDRYKSARGFCVELNRIVPEKADLVSYRFWDWRAGFAFYSGRKIRNLHSPEELAEYWNRSDRADSGWVIVENNRIEEARSVLKGYDPVLEREVGSRTASLFVKKRVP